MNSQPAWRRWQCVKATGVRAGWAASVIRCWSHACPSVGAAAATQYSTRENNVYNCTISEPYAKVYERGMAIFYRMELLYGEKRD